MLSVSSTTAEIPENDLAQPLLFQTSRFHLLPGVGRSYCGVNNKELCTEESELCACVCVCACFNKLHFLSPWVICQRSARSAAQRCHCLPEKSLTKVSRSFIIIVSVASKIARDITAMIVCRHVEEKVNKLENHTEGTLYERRRHVCLKPYAQRNSLRQIR